MLLIGLLLNFVLIHSLVLKTEVNKNLNLKTSESKQSYITNEDIICLKKMIHTGHSKPNKVINFPSLKLPNLFKKEDNPNISEKSSKLRLHTKLSNTAKSDLKCCGIEVKEIKPKPKGHYEKIERKVENYFWVNSDKPSGMPGSFVVSKKEAKFHLGFERR